MLPDRWLRALAWFIFALMVAFYGSGCAARLPADGRLVLVQVDENVAGRLVSVAVDGTTDARPRPLGESVSRGARYWDAVGARLRTYDDLSTDEWSLAPAATILVTCSNAVEDAFEGAVFGWYSDVDGKVRIDCSRLHESDAYTEDQLSAAFAHELGHALGLGHLPADDAVMNAHSAIRPGLSPADVAAFEAL